MKDLFRFTKGERIASFILLILTVLLLVVLFIVRHDRVAGSNEFSRFDSLIQFIMPEEREMTPDTAAIKTGFQPRPVNKTLRLSSHDPNAMTVNDWEQLGLNKHVILTIIHYRAAGGKFRKKEDLKKIYGLDDSSYQHIVPYLILPVPAKQQEESGTRVRDTNTTENKKEFVVSPAQKLEINQADSADFVRFRGITPVLARRIIRYRALLGGFAGKKQLLEVYGLNEPIYRMMENRITVDSARIRKININRCSEKKLAKHPYLTGYEAKAIIFYRTERRQIDSLPVLVKEKILPEQVFRKIRPYLEINEKK